MIHLPSRPKRQTIDQWKKIFTVGSVQMARSLYNSQRYRKKQNSRLSETDSIRSYSKRWVWWISMQFSKKRAICNNKALKPTNKRKHCQLDDF